MAASPKSCFIAATLALGAGCSAGGPDFVVHQTAVVVRSDALFARSPDLPQRVESTIDAALDYWGGSWKDLEDTTVTLDGDEHVPCNGATGAIGCFDGKQLRVSTRDPSLGPWNCVEATVLVHEIGHAVIGDPNHTDPRWMDFSKVAEELGGRRGYDGPCTVYPSVWRHVLARP